METEKDKKYDEERRNKSEKVNRGLKNEKNTNHSNRT